MLVNFPHRATDKGELDPSSHLFNVKDSKAINNKNLSSK